jgi:glycosyltransferase involved in cell wall biosynthesis
VLTPTWNRAEYLRDVWAGLDSQTVRCFEWVVANDGSSDETIEVVKELARQSDFPVTLTSASLRIGKSRMDNEAVKLAKGEFILWCDSDDILQPQALAVLLNTWDAIPRDKRTEFAGVTALCAAKGIALGNDYPKDDHSDLDLNKLLYRMKSDLVIFTRAELLKENPFKEVDFLISESSVWNKIGTLPTRFIPTVLKRVRYGEKHCLSQSGKMRYNRGHAHAIALTQPFAREHLSLMEHARRVINYGRYCIHGDIPVFESLKLWRANTGATTVLIALMPISVLLSIKDRLQQKVEKTHQEFDKAAARVKIERNILN